MTTHNPPTRIACIGDSITELTNYPQQLAEMLGENYLVGNFGVCGAKVTFDSDSPYRYSQAFNDAVNFQPKGAMIMLGTNDASIDLETHYENFRQDYQTLIEKFQSLTDKPCVWVVLPPPIFSQILGLNIDAYNREIIPAIKDAAKNMNLPIIDVYSALNKPRFFFDGVHPNEEGSKIIAEVIYRALTAK